MALHAPTALQLASPRPGNTASASRVLPALTASSSRAEKPTEPSLTPPSSRTPAHSITDQEEEEEEEDQEEVEDMWGRRISATIVAGSSSNGYVARAWMKGAQ